MREGISVKIARRARLSASSAALWGVDKVSYRLGLRNAAKLTLPDFLGLGAQKAGSSWLWANLRCHPDLYLPAGKELHYFNLYFYSSLASYAAQFEGGTGKLKGDITPAYSILDPPKIRFVRQIMRHVKLILILRNPIDRAWSRAKMVLSEPGDKEIDVKAFSRQHLLRALADPSSRARSDYLTIIDNWREHFPKEQLHICFFEDLTQRPKEFLTAIFAFLGVRSDVDWGMFPFEKSPNPTPPTTIPPQYRQLLEEMYCPQIEGLYERFGGKVEAWRCGKNA